MTTAVLCGRLSAGPPALRAALTQIKLNSIKIIQCRQSELRLLALLLSLYFSPAVTAAPASYHPQPRRNEAKNQ